MERLMGLFGWLKRKAAANGGDPLLADWRRRWHELVAEPDADRTRELATALEQLGLPDDEIEIEREMLAGLQQLGTLKTALAAGDLPVVVTGHKVVASEVCHFTAPASLPDDPAQPSGRLIVTNARAIFVGGPRATIVPWHSVVETAHDVRDVLLVKQGPEAMYRFRCNSFADALCGELLARHLAGGRRRGTAPSRV
ncbi:MAG TPA: hypothetical protein VD833_02495 [Vicinamibacterales bacterium]|nr:hypothetical protein [Vicinamibacterales bacterium]